MEIGASEKVVSDLKVDGPKRRRARDDDPPVDPTPIAEQGGTEPVIVVALVSMCMFCIVFG